MTDNATQQLTIADEVEACAKFSKHLLENCPNMHLTIYFHLKGDMLMDLVADLRHRFEHGTGLISEEEERKRGSGNTLLEEVVLVADHTQFIYKFAMQAPPAVNRYLRDVTILLRSAAIELHSMIFHGKPTVRYVRPYPASASLWNYGPDDYAAIPLTVAVPVNRDREEYLGAFPQYPDGQDFLRGFDSGEKSVIDRQKKELAYRKEEVQFRLERELRGFSKATKDSELYGFLGQMAGLVEGGLLDKERSDELSYLAKTQVFSERD